MVEISGFRVQGLEFKVFDLGLEFVLPLNPRP